jgi:spore germination protein KA
MAAGHEGVPFPSVLEAILMIVLFDILKEAGVRLPKPVGSAISIVGALVLGESAVAAGLVGPFMVIVVAITAISSFAVPSLTDSASVLRYFLLIVAGFLGGFGIVMGLLLVLIHLTSLSSFDVPYLSPIAPFVRREANDTLVRAPLLSMVFRPGALAASNIERRDTQQPKNQNDEVE